MLFRSTRGAMLDMTFEEVRLIFDRFSVSPRLKFLSWQGRLRRVGARRRPPRSPLCPGLQGRVQGLAQPLLPRACLRNRVEVCAGAPRPRRRACLPTRPGGGGRYTGDEIPEADLRGLMRRSYVNFADQQDPVPTKAVGDLHIMELFHGPTFAFKDVALQALGARNATRHRKCDAAAQSKPTPRKSGRAAQRRDLRR